MFSRLAVAGLAALALALATCRQPEPARPALWEVTGPGGQQAWLFGTVHALPRPVAWQTGPVRAALAAADRIVVEVADGDDPARNRAVFGRLGTSAGLPPLRQRIDPAQRPALDRLLARLRQSPDDYARTETWAAALAINRALAASVDHSARHGIEAELRAATAGRRTEQLEGLERQLAIFDRLPEDDQRALLASVVAAAPGLEAELAAQRRAWQHGDIGRLARLDHRGMLADPELRAALLVGRNRAWARQIAGMMRQGGRPFVAVGALHLAGADGLQPMLAAQGYAVRRIQ